MIEPFPQPIYKRNVDAVRNQFVSEQLIAFNTSHSTASQTPDRTMAAAPLEVYALGTSSVVIGGLIGRTHAIQEWLEITTVWVDESARRHGIGRTLMAHAEQEALARGCHYARLATSTFQAPGFYEKMGYLLYGTLKDCPAGVTCLYYWKGLTAS